MRQEKPLRNEQPRTTCVPVLLRFLIGFLLLAAVLAGGVWIQQAEDQPRTYCVDDRANPVCDRTGPGQ